MPSLVPGYEYDIFISYRQNDNARGWVTEFVKSLREELAATIKDPLAVYFDANPEGGLLETHHVDKSLEGKLKCLVFIPIVSQTYCDPKCFAWQNEFLPFNRLSKSDPLGRDLKLASGNVASRILPVRIHDLETEDRLLLEREIGGAIRSVEFIYKYTGVNRPLGPTDNPDKNHNKTDYRDQVNKVANAVKELVYAIKYPGRLVESSTKGEESKAFSSKTPDRSSKVNDHSIAVLPFVNLTQDPSQEYFADGVMENILIQLAGIRQLQVISRTSVMRYRQTTQSLPEIATELGVRYILEGSAQAHGNKVRINVQLIDAASDQPVWGKAFVESLDDIFTIQNNVAEFVTRELRASLMPDENKKLKEVPTRNVKAFDLFLKGRHAFNRWNLEGYRTAEKYFRLSLEEDPEFAQAYSYLASTYTALMSWNGDLSPEESLIKINQYLPEAIKRGATDNDYLTQAFVELFVNKDLVAAERKLKEAMEIGPNNAEIRYTYSYVLSMMGRMEEALEEVEKAKPLDPTSASSFHSRFVALYLLKRHDEALALVREAIQLYPYVLRLYDHLARALVSTGQFKETVSTVNAGLKTVTFRPPSMIAYMAIAHLGLNEKEKSTKLLDELIERSGNRDKGVNLYIAHIYIAMGNLEKAKEWLAMARKTNDIDLIWYSVDPLLAPLRESYSAPDYAGAERFIQEKLRQELSEKLHYHNTEHVEDVLQSALAIAKHEQLKADEVRLLRIGALFHDSGMTLSHKQHEEKGCDLARQLLPSYGFNEDQLDIICGMIMATKIPQSPKTQLEKILCDADLDYLGRDDFYTIGQKLHDELRESGTIETEREWNLIQKTFLENHHYHTAFSQANREPKKQQHLSEIVEKLKKQR